MAPPESEEVEVVQGPVSQEAGQPHAPPEEEPPRQVAEQTLLFWPDLVRAIHEVLRGMTYLSPGISQAVVEAYLAKSAMPPDPLTAREREVLQLVAEGKSTKEIAQLLGITFKTAESHRTRIMKKTNIHETASLVRYAVRRGLIQP